MLVEQKSIVVEVVQQTNYWWALCLVIVPVFLAFFLNRKKAFSKKKVKSK